MAAYAALVSLEHVIGLTPPYVQQEYVSIQIQNRDDYIVLIHLCRKEEMKSLNDDVIFLQKLLEKFPKKWVSLERRIRYVSHRLEDIIESFMSGQPYTLLASDGRELHWSQVKSEFRSCSQDLHSLVEETDKMEISVEHDEDMPIPDSSEATSTSTNDDKHGKDSMVGFEEDLSEILDRATGHDRARQFIPIVGMGGIGKTTLARNVFDHPSIVHRFNIRSWVTVSQDYRLRDILLGLLSNDITGTHQDDESLIEILFKKLKNRRYLVVLDDMWHGEVWDKIMRALPGDDDTGSRIIITTRLSEVAAEIDPSSSIHQMKFLNQNQSWSLMSEKVFGKNYCYPPPLEKLGKIISSSCKGLPLAITVIAGLLESNKAQDYWEEIARNVSEAVASDNDLDGILSLSYENLPHHMKACFLYMGVFPEDYFVESDVIVRLCVAEGFVKPEGGKCMETVAKECVEDLVRRNLLLEDTHLQGYRKYLRMHDILRELCLKKAQEEYFLLHCKGKFIDEINFSKIVTGHRRIILDRNTEFGFLPNRRYTLSFRSAISVGDSLFCYKYLPLFSSTQFMLLRILHKLTIGVEHHCIVTSDDSILFKLIHLRLLSFQGSIRDHDDSKIHISSSLVQLQNLQALDFDGFWNWIIILPWNIWRMPKLRHLSGSDVVIQFSDLPYCGGTLEFLQTLSFVENFKFTNDAVNRFPNLKTLRIHYDIENNEDWGEYFLDNLVHLEELDVSNSDDDREQGPLPINLAFPKNIKILRLNGYDIPEEIMSKMSTLVNLEVLQLEECWFECELFEEEFPKLKCLKISSLKEKEWNFDDTNFPCLEELFLVDCHNIEIPDSMCDIPTLEKLFVSNCFGKTFESAKRIQDEQLRTGNSTFQIYVSK